MLSENQISYLLEVLEPVKVIRIEGKLFPLKQITSTLKSRGLTAFDQVTIEVELNEITSKDFDDYLDKKYEPIEIEEIKGTSWDASEVLKKMDTIGYDNAFIEWKNDQESDGEIIQVRGHYYKVDLVENLLGRSLLPEYNPSSLVGMEVLGGDL